MLRMSSCDELIRCVGDQMPSVHVLMQPERPRVMLSLSRSTLTAGRRACPVASSIVLRPLSAAANPPSWARPPFPPYNAETAREKVRLAEAAWNTKDPEKVALAYTEDSEWRNRSEFLKGREAIKAFLRKKWSTENQYSLMKELWGFMDNRVSARFEYEWVDEKGQWWRSHGNEQWEFDQWGLMKRRDASINDVPIKESERRYHRDPVTNLVIYNPHPGRPGDRH